MNKKLELFKQRINGKKIAVLGIGISNKPLIKFLVKNGAIVTAFDRKLPEELGDTYNELKELKISFSLGEDYLKNLDHEIIFKTPGMRFDIPELLEAKKRGSVVTSEMEVFFDLCPAEIIGITGSDGKTTTTTLVYLMLQQGGYTCWLGGNIGKPLLDEIENIESTHKVIVELSSFQLQTMRTSPNIAIITNITPNHLDVHKSMEEYIEAKKNIFLHQDPFGKLVVNYDNEITKKFGQEAIGNFMYFSRKSEIDNGVFLQDNDIFIKVDGKKQKVISISDIMIPGMHNVENYMAAISAVWGIVNVDAIKAVANSFKGVEHRIEFVREVNGVKFYNSSIDSSPNRTIATLNTFNQKVILIAGGKDKNIPYDELGDVLVQKVKSLILIGQTADKIEKALKDKMKQLAIKNEIPVYRCSTYKEVVQTAYSNAQAGDIVVLSPASTSFDMFKNFEERGRVFKELVNEL